jgi:hypothetical protein
MSVTKAEAAALAILREPATIRTRSHALLDRAVEGRSAYFVVELGRLEAAADYVAAVIRDAYPTLEIPYHARWRHFAAGGRDRWGALSLSSWPSASSSGPGAVSSGPGAFSSWPGLTRPSQPEPCGTGSPRTGLDGMAVSSPAMTIGHTGMTIEHAGETIDHTGMTIDHTGMTIEHAGETIERTPMTTSAELARIRFDLCVVSVLLDAGAGADWRFVEPGMGETVTRSEGLAIASLHAFREGLFSGDPLQPLRADADGLAATTASRLAEAFQAGPDNKLEGLEGRAALLRSLGEVLRQRPDVFGTDARIGNLFDTLAAQATDGTLPARAILAAVLDGLGPIWPDRLRLGGESLGDVWHHPAIEAPDLTAGLIPFHKLSQWLSYSLVEVLEEAGIRVTDLDALTGLPEYRNGGLFLDLGVIALRQKVSDPLPVSDPLIVEWRALTVALLDRIADPIRSRLGQTAADMPLARILEGGTWAAGRRIARERRAGGGPPLSVISDGTVF